MGWNSTLALVRSSSTATVSIPNGMEFYQKRLKMANYARAFQFPMGWNSTSAVFGSVCSSKLFQFPTGWNSTQFSPRIFLSAPVSIPNGMEFYVISWKKQRLYCCFNFQRDEILHRFAAFEHIFKTLFQFPTGWNSTRRRIRKAFSNACFNSQRDGILRWMSYLIR